MYSRRVPHERTVAGVVHLCRLRKTHIWHEHILFYTGLASLKKTIVQEQVEKYTK